ncbi:MAG: hypothetical protein L6Q57_00285 [Alphaproteobacteria bacterium]|nr:hypothetical protein [Alphaproteobacteria bacterium]
MAKKKKKPVGYQGQILLIFGGITAAVFLPTTVLLAIGCLPTVVAAFVDSSRRKTQAITVGAMNIAGCAPFVFELWQNGNGMTKAISIVTDPMIIVVMYTAAAIGYLIDWSMTGIVANVLYQRGLARQKAIIARQEALVEIWGKEVTGEIPLDQWGFALDSQRDKRH